MLLSVSSSMAMSALRDTRNSVACSMATPANSLCALRRTRSCSATKQRSPEGTSDLSATQGGRLVGTFTRMITGSGTSGSRSTKPQEVERFDMNGSGSEGSRLRGVSAGETCRSK